MKARSKLYPTTVILVLAAWGILFLQNILDLEILKEFPPIVPVLLTLLGAVALLRSYATRQTRLILCGVVVLVLAAGFALLLADRDFKVLERKWRKADSDAIKNTILAVGENIQELADCSDYIGNETKKFLEENDPSLHEDSLAFSLEIFEVLENLAEEVAGSGTLPPGTEIGMQLLDANGRITAWAGWSQPLMPENQQFILGDKEVFYTREVSLYRILTRIFPIDSTGSVPGGWIIVDAPIEVNYKVNNKYLKSTSLAENIAAKFPVKVRFDYYRPALSMREREGKQSALEDSIRIAYGFPSYIEPLSRIAGDKTLGLNGSAKIKSPQGIPLLNVTVHGSPFRHFADNYSMRFVLFAKICIVLSLLALFILSLTWFSAKHAALFDSIKILYLILIFVALRFSLLSFQQTPAIGGLQVFNPAIFATPLLGGLMRSAGDLLITALFFIMALYAVLKIARGRMLEKEEEIPPAMKGSYLWKGFISAVVLFLILELSQRFISTVVTNANPRLLGETMKVFQIQVLVLHMSMFLMLSGVFLSGLLCLWGIMRIRGMHDAPRAGGVAILLITLASIIWWRSELVIISLFLILFLVFAPRVTRREDLVSIVIIAFAFVVGVSGAAYIFLNDEYQNLRKSFIREKVDELAQPLDNWKVFILEDIMEDFSEDLVIRQALRRPKPDVTRRLAFDLWAGSPLSLLGYSSAVYVLSAEDSVLARFAVDMPFRVKPYEETERTGTGPVEGWVVLDLTRSTPQGGVRFYRGIVNIEDIVSMEERSVERVLLGKVIVDMPFSFENLAWAARTGPRTPELLRNVQEGSIEPRLEEPEALLLAHLRESRIIESSSEDLPVGMSLSEERLEKARELRWPLLRTRGGTYRYMIEDSDVPGRLLLAGFRVPSPLWHVLRWSTIFSLYLFFTVGILVLIIFLRQLPRVGSLLPTLTPGRQLGFQQKLLGSFLLVALLPAIILGIFSVQVIRDRFISENKEEALYKAFSARKSLVNLLSDECESFLGRTDLEALFSGDVTPGGDKTSKRMITVLDESGVPLDWRVEESKIEKRETEPLKNQILLTGEKSQTSDSLEVLEKEKNAGPSPGDVWVVWEKGVPYIGVVSRPITFFGEVGSRTCFVYYARNLDGDLLGDIADQVGADINVYDGGYLVASSREGLLTGGFIRPLMNASAFVKVSLLGVEQSVSTERTGDYSYQVAYLPLGSGGKSKYAALSLPLLFRPEPYHVEVQKATSIVLGIFALLFAATIGLGLLLARGIFEPLKGLLEGTKRISRGDLSFKLPSAGSDEIGTVVNAFNEMTGQLDRSQRVLEERRRYLEVILVNIGTGVVSTDKEDRILTVNNAAERILGIDASNVVGKAPETLVVEGVAPEIFSLLKGRGEKDAPFFSSEVDIVRDGTKRTIKYMLTKLVFDGKHLGTVFVFEDLTELINSKKLSAWVEMARQIAHEIKNPLTPIKLSTQFMKRAHEAKSSDFDRIFDESSHTIIQQVEVLKRIAGEFSSFGRMQQLEIASHKLVPLVEKIVAPYRSNSSRVEISSEYSSENVTVLVDPEAMRKICMNLIENAMEAMPDGGRLSVRVDEMEADGVAYARLSFTDTGPGLTNEIREKLFEPYFSTKTTGTGLGLAICQTLSQEMGGEVTVENVPCGTGVEAVVKLKVG